MSHQSIEPIHTLKKQTPDILTFAINEYKMGRTEETVKGRISALNRISEKANLTNPDEVLFCLATIKWKNHTKNTFLDTYGAYCRFYKIQWQRPKYENEERLPFIPTEAELDQLIYASQQKMATLLQTLKETGIRISEALKLKWIDLDTTNKTLNITPSKGSNPRILPISTKLITMLEKCNHPNEYIFPRRKHGIRTRFCTMRKRISQRQQNQRLMQISFHTFRHWRGTMEYHKTKDIMHVKYILGHKAIQSTMVYINLEQATFLTQSADDEWTCKAAKTIDEATKLIEAGFQYVTTIEGTQLFKKRK